MTWWEADPVAEPTPSQPAAPAAASANWWAADPVAGATPPASKPPESTGSTFLDGVKAAIMGPDPARTEAAVLHAAHGYSGGLLDEALAATPATVGRYAASKVMDVPDYTGKSLAEIYRMERDRIRGRLDKTREEYPVTATVADIGGSVVSPINKVLPGGPTKAQAAINAAVSQGAIQGFGRSDADVLQDPVQVAEDTAMGGFFGGIVTKGAGKLLPQSDKAVIDAAAKSDLPVTVGAVRGTPTAKATESTLAQLPFSGYFLRRTRESLTGKADEAVQAAAGKISGNAPSTAEGAGALLRKGIGKAEEAVNGKIDDYYDGLINAVPPVDSAGRGTFDPVKAKAYAARMLDLYKGNPAAQKIIGAEQFKQLKDIVDGPLDAQSAKNLRPFIRDLSAKATKDGSKQVAAAIDGFNRALNDDIADTVAKYVPNGESLLKQADRKAKAAYGLLDKLAELKPDDKTSEQLIAKLFQITSTPAAKSAKGSDAALLRALNRRVPKEVMDDLSAYYLQSMGLKGEAFSAPEFARQWEALSPQAKTLLFKNRMTGDQYRALDGVAKYVKDGFGGSFNPSGSGTLVGEGAAGASVMTAALTGTLQPATALVAASPAVVSGIMSNPALAKAYNRLPRELLASGDAAKIARALTAAGFSITSDQPTERN